jgi:hypothetical protein
MRKEVPWISPDACIFDASVFSCPYVYLSIVFTSSPLQSSAHTADSNELRQRQLLWAGWHTTQRAGEEHDSKEVESSSTVTPNIHRTSFRNLSIAHRSCRNLRNEKAGGLFIGLTYFNLKNAQYNFKHGIVHILQVKNVKYSFPNAFSAILHTLLRGTAIHFVLRSTKVFI